MKYRTRKYYTAEQKALMWERWKEGWTLHQIGQLVEFHVILTRFFHLIVTHPIGSS